MFSDGKSEIVFLFLWIPCFYVWVHNLYGTAANFVSVRLRNIAEIKIRYKWFVHLTQGKQPELGYIVNPKYTFKQ